MMQYFVSIENNQYMRWQVELLYESMRLLGIEKQLIVAACPTPDSKTLPWNTVYHENLRPRLNYHAANRTWGLLTAIRQNALKQPFVVMDPDMVLLNKIPVLETTSGQNVNYMSYEHVSQIQGFPLKDRYGINKDQWISVGCVMQFKEYPEDFFEEVHDILMDMLQHTDSLSDHKAYWQREMVAWCIAFSRREYPIQLLNNYEMPLDPRLRLPEKDAYIIHYCNGCYPYFDKRFHNKSNWFSMGLPLPFENIISIPFHDFYIHKFIKITQSFLELNSHRINDI